MINKGNLLYILLMVIFPLSSVSQKEEKQRVEFLGGSIGGVFFGSYGGLGAIDFGMIWPKVYTRVEYEMIWEDYVGSKTEHKNFAGQLSNFNLLFGIHHSLGKITLGAGAGPLFGWGTPRSTLDTNFDFTNCVNCGVSHRIQANIYDESWLYGGNANLFVDWGVSQTWRCRLILGFRYYEIKWKGYSTHPEPYSHKEWRALIKVGVTRKLIER